MTIKSIKTHVVSAQLDHPFWMSLEPYTASSELIVEVDAGDAVGYGVAHGRPLAQIETLVLTALAPRVLGRDPIEHEALWEDMFSITTSREGADYSAAEGQPHFGGVKPQLMAAIAALDIAIWDLKGKLLGEPVYRLLGGRRTELPVYASGGYYHGGDEIASVLEEVRGYWEAGFRAVKIKVGGVDLRQDVGRIAAIRDALPEVDLMLDANCAYSVPDAIRAAHAFEPYSIRWLEEPTHWYDPVEGLGRVSGATSIPIASGESSTHRWQCRDLVDRSGIEVMQFDCTRAGGVTEWLRVAAYAAHHGITMAPHHDPQIHGHMLAAIPNGEILEFFPDEKRDPLWGELYESGPTVEAGVCTLSDAPGFGIEYDWSAIERRRSSPAQEAVAG